MTVTSDVSGCGTVLYVMVISPALCLTVSWYLRQRRRMFLRPSVCVLAYIHTYTCRV